MEGVIAVVIFTVFIAVFVGGHRLTTKVCTSCRVRMSKKATVCAHCGRSQS